MEFRGKRALVTGASRGIGAAIADRLEELGAQVLRSSRDGPLAADLQNDEDCRRLASAVRAPLDILVNNAGTFQSAPIEETDLGAARRLFELNFWAPLRLVQLLLPSFRPAASIVGISSLNAVLPQSGTTVYCASKAALEMATRCLARELAPRGIRVNAVAPGPVPTDLLREAVGSEDLSYMLPHIPLGRLGTGRDVAEAVAFLAGERASWITGQVIRIDGGMS